MHDWENFRNSNYFKSIEDDEVLKKCLEHVKLSNEDIEDLIAHSKMLPIISEIEGGCDTFIDCFTNDKDVAIVISQSSPKDSLYLHSFIGKLIYRDYEPGVFYAYESENTQRNIKGIIHHEHNLGEVLIKQTITVLKNRYGKKIGVLIVEKPVGKQSDNFGESDIHNKVSINNFNEKYSITNIIADGILCFNLDGICVFANNQAKTFYENHFDKENILGESFLELKPTDVSISDILENRIIVINGQNYSNNHYKIVYSVINEGDSNFGFAIIIKDITEKVLKDKELILKSLAILEIHHRVKNNLQTIISLIRMQSKRTDNPDTKIVCNEIINRIHSIAVTHEILAKNGLDKIYIKEVISLMVTNTLSYVSSDNLDLKIDVIGDNLYVDSEISCTVVIIINELIQNSIKHGFFNKKSGNIVIKVLQNNLDCSIIVNDDGNGFKDNNTDVKNLGLGLVRGLVEDKLQGTLSISSDNNGVEVTFSFLNQFLNI